MLTKDCIVFPEFKVLNNEENVCDNVRSLFTTRIGGVSSGCYASNNLGLHVNDDKKSVLENRKQLTQFINNNFLQNQNDKTISISWMNQVHSDKVKVVKSIADALVVEEVDAQVTREKNIALAVMTADCLPVLLRSIDGDVVAAVHCGWKGLASNVLENTILAMNCERNKIMAWLGPCIGEKCFEVGKEVKQIFEDKNLALGQFFKQTDEVHYLADLKGIAKFILNQLNVYNVSVNEECTYSNVDKYYSYRKEKITGRMAGVIWI
jgi:YfiH family protein